MKTSNGFQEFLRNGNSFHNGFQESLGNGNSFHNGFQEFLGNGNELCTSAYAAASPDRFELSVLYLEPKQLTPRHAASSDRFEPEYPNRKPHVKRRDAEFKRLTETILQVEHFKVGSRVVRKHVAQQILTDPLPPEYKVENKQRAE